MTAGAAQGRSELWAEQWAIDAAVKAATIEHQTRIAQSTPGADDPRRREVVQAIEALLASARRATRRGRLPWRSPSDLWRGTSVVQAYQSLHAAEIFLVELLAPEQILVLIPKVVARGQTVFGPTDPRRAAIDALPAMAAAGDPATRAALQQAMSIGYDAADELHVRVRNFRNILLATAALIAVLMGTLVFLVSNTPTAIPLCFSPPAAAAPATGASPTDAGPTADTVCPSGNKRQPSPGDVLIVVGLGLLGGAIAAALSIRNMRGTSTPYDVPIALALLKVPSGALTALAGIILLGGNFVPGLSELDSQRQILAYALVLGYAQQLATRFIDHQGQSILNSLPSKDPDGKQPTPSPTVPQAPHAPPAPEATAMPVLGAEPPAIPAARAGQSTTTGRRPAR